MNTNFYSLWFDRPGIELRYTIVVADVLALIVMNISILMLPSCCWQLDFFVFEGGNYQLTKPENHRSDK